MNTEQSIRYNNLLDLARFRWEAPRTYADMVIAEDYLAQALMLLRIEIKAAEATK